MPEHELAAIMQSFTHYEVDVLLCTSIIESGLDIPNANTLIVDRGDAFGLAQLYQLRGRVGRGAQRAYAYFFRHNRIAPTPEGQERLEVIAENTQLGAGYSIAMRDLEMRGAGEILGNRQHGYIASVGFHLYTRLLSQAVRAQRKDWGCPNPKARQSWARKGIFRSMSSCHSRWASPWITWLTRISGYGSTAGWPIPKTSLRWTRWQRSLPTALEHYRKRCRT